MAANEVTIARTARPDAFERKLVTFAGVTTFVGLVAWPALVISIPASIVAALMVREGSRGTRVLAYSLAVLNVVIAAAVWAYHSLTT